jgi:membrane fusion protein, multidrug efflux system
VAGKSAEGAAPPGIKGTSSGRGAGESYPKSCSAFASQTTVSLLILVCLVSCHKTPSAPSAPTALTVDTALARIQPIPLEISAVGQVVPERSVQVRAQVTGMLTSVRFTEGNAVKAGQPLLQIEPAPFEVAVRATRAAWDTAKANADRAEQLIRQGFVTQQDFRGARNAAEQADAAYAQAKINLSYTDIHAPIAGRTGSLTVKAGNVVAPTDPAALVTINQMKPIDVRFSIPQQRGGIC